jgi:hypothetical protein
MVFTRMWADTWLLNMNWQCYVQRSFGPTPAWQFDPAKPAIVMRSPDPLLYQGGDW